MRKLTGAAKIKHEQRLKRLRALMGEESTADEKETKAAKPKSNPDPQPPPEPKPQPNQSKKGFRLFDPEELEQWWNM